MSLRVVVRTTSYLVAVAAGFALVLAAIAWLFAPGASYQPAVIPAEKLRAAEAARRVNIDPANPLVLYRQADYSQGSAGAWYPKRESPLLADLVRDGRLPPVAERTGSEPAVVEGVEGIGQYGGTWVRVAISPGDVFTVMNSRMTCATLLRFSPQGYPLVPHVAKSVEASADYREFTITLRKGMRWSDGEPYSADDIMYWWNKEVNERLFPGPPPAIMKVGPDVGTVQKLDDYRVRFSFPRPNGLFMLKLASPDGADITDCPAHYLAKYHPVSGDKQAIAEMMKARGLGSPLAVYRALKAPENPEHPRLWPWVYRTHRANPPYSFVRNPYYFMVDPQGNQLPYVDRVFFEVKNADMVGHSATNGQITMQERHLRYSQYTLLMSEREANGYHLKHWYSGDGSDYVFIPNATLRVDPARPETAKKRALLADRRFRQALSLSLNRREIIRAEYNGQTEPAQVAPGPRSLFHDPDLQSAFIQFDPAAAARLLDDLGLSHRDFEGYRTFADGSRMTFYLNISDFIPAGTAQLAVDDWSRAGLRVVLRIRTRGLWQVENAAGDHDLTAWSSDSEFLPLLAPRFLVPVGGSVLQAATYSRWFNRGGLYGDSLATAEGCEEPPPGSPTRRAMEIYDQICSTGDLAKQRDLFRQITQIAAQECWTINICAPPPAVVVVQDGFRNVPDNVVNCWNFLTPGNAGTETYFFDTPRDTPGTIQQIKQSVLTVTPPPYSPTRGAGFQPASSRLSSLLKYSLLLIAAILLLLAGVRHPYIGRRLANMVPTLLVISILVFVVIQLPPGDFVTSRIMQLQQSGDQANISLIEDLRLQHHLDDPPALRYLRWMGLRWFVTFDAADEGLLQGNLGRSMESGQNVNDVVGDRIWLTVLISLGTILFTWAIAIPIGIYSAVRQHSAADYLLTFLGFVGMCVPSFLLALVLMYLAKRFGGVEITGLFSSQYGSQAEWDWPKAMDLLKHIWLPVLVLGVGGTAGMIRVMRGNLLDELKKPYVTTARAKGVRPLKLLVKYPVRLALNPFISGIGGLFPQLVSGGAIVAMVLSLPTVGPLMLAGLLTEDAALAGSMLMVLSILGVMGTLVSDLLLLWLDPRIRLKGGAK